MEYFRGVKNTIEDGWINVRANIEAVFVVAKLSQAFQDVGLVESDDELKGMSTGEFRERLEKMGKQMADMKPNELQEFVNSKIDPIEDKGRKKRARWVLQWGIKEYISEKTE